MAAIPSGRPVAGLCVIGLGTSLPPLDLAVNVAFPAISTAFELDTPGIRWVVAAYVVSYASLMLAFGSLGDSIGYRRIFRAGLILGAFAFVGCALAPGYDWLLAARMVQGVAAALLLSCAPALATSLFEESLRIRVLGACSSMAAAAAVAAPLLGGLATAALGWAGVFWFRVPIALLALALLPLLPVVAQPAHSPGGRGFDPPGATLLAGGIAFLLLAPTLIQARDSNWGALGAAVASTVLLARFARRQRGAAQPFLPRAAVRDPGFVLLNIASASVHFTGFAIPLLLPYYLVRVAGYAPLQIGALLTLWPVGILAGSMLAAMVARHIGRRATAALGGALLAAGQFAMGWPAAGLMLPGMLLNGVGIGLYQVAYTDIVIAILPRHDRGVAGGLTILTRTIGIVLGASALSAALQFAELRFVSAGHTQADAFVAAFEAVFRISAIAFAVVFLLTSSRGSPQAPGEDS